MTEKTYLYDGSMEGLMMCVFEAYYRHENPSHIESENTYQLRFEMEYVHIETSREKSDRVMNAVRKKISFDAWYNVLCAFLSEREGIEKHILEYIRLGFKVGKNVDMHLTDDSVRQVIEAAKCVSGEAHKYKGLLRFSELANGAFYSEIEPKSNVLPILARHFERRLSAVPWLIYDSVRQLVCVYDTKMWYIRGTGGVLTELSDDEEKYRELWREFYNTIEIKDRHNEKCRMTNMPKRYWAHLTEMQG